jgi:hypothetical protein
MMCLILFTVRDAVCGLLLVPFCRAVDVYVLCCYVERLAGCKYLCICMLYRSNISYSLSEYISLHYDRPQKGNIHSFGAYRVYYV